MRTAERPSAAIELLRGTRANLANPKPVRNKLLLLADYVGLSTISECAITHI
jgi:hypothetical protein